LARTIVNVLKYDTLEFKNIFDILKAWSW